jgi:hypothetical protein
MAATNPRITKTSVKNFFIERPSLIARDFLHSSRISSS